MHLIAQQASVKPLAQQVIAPHRRRHMRLGNEAPVQHCATTQIGIAGARASSLSVLICVAAISRALSG